MLALSILMVEKGWALLWIYLIMIYVCMHASLYIQLSFVMKCFVTGIKCLSSLKRFLAKPLCLTLDLLVPGAGRCDPTEECPEEGIAPPPALEWQPDDIL